MDPFAARLVLAFVVGGGTVALFTLAAERMGSRVGGLLLTFPIKVALTLVLVAANEGAALAAEAAAFAPAGLAANVAFLGVAVLLLRSGRSLGAALAVGLAVWLGVAAAAIATLPARLPWTLPACGAAAIAAFVALSRDRAHHGASRAKPKPGSLGVGGRALFAGIVVAAAVAAARAIGAEAGGVLSVFPSGFLTSLVILHRAHGSAFTAQTARTMVAGAVGPALYVSFVAWSYPRFDVAAATVAAIGVAILSSALVGLALNRADAAAAGEAVRVEASARR